MELTSDEEKMIRSYPFITRKKMVIALNVAEDDLGNRDLLARFEPACQNQAIEAMLVSAKVEAEIALLDTSEEKQEFLDALGIGETALETLTRLCLRSLNLISFFTVGKDEVRQWLVREGSTAPQAAGVIHSDLERGFIRAEVFSYDDLISLGSEPELKKAGRFLWRERPIRSRMEISSTSGSRFDRKVVLCLQYLFTSRGGLPVSAAPVCS